MAVTAPGRTTRHLGRRLEAGCRHVVVAAALGGVILGALGAFHPQRASAAGPQRASAAGSYQAAGRGGRLLPPGWLSTRGSRYVDDAGQAVRIASIGWYGAEGPPGYALQGLWAASYTSICDSIVAAGFNTVRIAWSDANLDTRPLNTPAAGSVDFKRNPDLVGRSTWEMFGKIVDYAATIGLKVIFDHHTNDGGGGQQPNGLWFDAGPGSDGTDGAGHVGTISASTFKANWLRFATKFAANPTVIGFDLHNEPHGVNWGEGGPRDIRAMYIDVGDTIGAVNPHALIICEGIQDYRGHAPEGDLRLAMTKPIVLRVPHKLVYSIHSYPSAISSITPDHGPLAVARFEAGWGFVARQDLAPVWIGELGASDPGPGGAAHPWAETLINYMNSFTPPLSGSWWNIGSEATGASPNGIQTAWGLGHYRSEQLWATDQMLFRP